MKTLLTKAPWLVVLPSAPGSPLKTEIMTQDDFVRQYYPSSHRIKDTAYYPDIYRVMEEPVYDEDGNDTGKTVSRTYVEKVPRFAFAYQQLITLKHLVHLCGNDIQFDLNTSVENEKTKKDVEDFHDGWHKKHMEHAFYEFAKSCKRSGDVAFVAYFENNQFGWDVLSYFKGDRLYPHFGHDGKLEVFARRYTDFGDEMITERLEVWDKTYLHRLHRATSNDESPKTLFFGNGASTYSLDGFVYDDPTVGAIAHGFNDRVPVVYLRSEEGPCWAASQDSIEEYEISFSQMAHNNKMFGEPILYLQGDNVEANHDMNGTIKTLTMGPNDKAGFIGSQSASDSYMKELESLHDHIFEQSFVVTPPELKSGDLPAAALKILYSPAVEKGANDAETFEPALNEMVYLFEYGYGLEINKSLDLTNLPIRPWIKVYVHQNDSAVTQDLATAVQNGFLSRRSASERLWFYAVGNEYERIMAEKKEEEQQDLLAAFEKQKLNEDE